MFIRYSALAAALMLAVSINTALAAENGYETLKKGALPTQQQTSGQFHRGSATYRSSSPTNNAVFTTSGAIFRSSSTGKPTVFPQQTGFYQSDAQRAPSPGQDYTTQSVLMQEQMMMNLLNLDRKNNGLAALAMDEELCRIARIKSADMRDQGYFAHESPTYGNVREMLRHFGYPYAGAGENIAHHANVNKAQAAFMSSPAHRANILSKAWTKAGIGIVFDAQGFIYATQIFAR